MVAKRATSVLTKMCFSTEYHAVLNQQLADDITEHILIKDFDFKDHVWIPHRPVIQSGSSTTMISLVFSCSLKSYDLPSLNEAA